MFQWASGFMQKCQLALFKAILLKMGKIEVNLTCICKFSLPLWLGVSQFLITPENLICLLLELLG